MISRRPPVAESAPCGEFLAFYESAHRNPANRLMHHIAHIVAVAGIIAMHWQIAIGGSLIATSFLLSWVGHFIFEKNTPALFDPPDDRTIADRAVRKVQVALGGIVWSGACFLRIFG